jgi:hypothetical protein
MYESENKKVREIVRLIQMDGCTIVVRRRASFEGKKITLDELPKLCENLSDSDKEEISALVEAIAEELDVLCAERQQLDAQIKPLKAVKQKLARLI